MSWQSEHEARITKFPADIREAHKHSIRHRGEVLASTICGCFYCTAMFPPVAVKDWIDQDADGVGQTALCPQCGIDSVIGDRSGFLTGPEFLTEMKKYWF